MDEREARQELYDVMAQEAGFESKVEEALALGERYLGVDNAHLSEVHPDSDHWKTIASTDPPDGDFPTGLTLNLQTTYCRRVIAENDSIALHDAPNQSWADDPAFQTHGLHSYHGSPLTIDGQPYGTICFVSQEPRDEPFSEEETLFAELIARLLEHELQRERTLTRLERLEQFANVLAHDLRNPLASAIGYVDLARDTSNVEHLATAQQSLDRIETIISSVLTMARQGRAVGSTQEVQLRELCEECWSIVETADAELNIIDDLTIRASPDRLQHLFENLIRNAVEHGGPGVTVRVGALADEDGFFVEDTGHGIPKSERNKVFDRGQSTGEEGLGIGLAIVHGVVAAHDWDIAVTNGADGGARFEIRDVVVLNDTHD